MSAKPQTALQLDEDLESKYEIFDELGGGGMGRVLRARHRQLKRWVAIKLLHTDLKASESVARFLREARAAAHIRSAHVAHVMDAGILRRGQPYIVMEYLQGQDLSRLVATSGRLPVEQAVDYILQALDALAEAHSLQIVHRDIKPGNLFATKVAGGDIAIKVLDFGLAKSSGMTDSLDPTVTERGAVLGTPSYMSPEQFVNAQDVDVRADVWGIGATLFELLSGVPPFTGTTLPQVYSAVMHEPLPALRRIVPGLPEELERVVARCLTRERDERYENVAELAEALSPFANGLGRARVDRIRRVVSTLRTGDDVEPPVSERYLRADLTATERPEVGPISSTFERGRAAPGEGSLPTSMGWRASKRTMASLAVVVLLAALGGAAWSTWRDTSTSAVTTPMIATPAKTHVRTQTAVPVRVPTATTDPPPSPERAEPPKAREATVAPPTAARPKRVKARAQQTQRRTKASIYEKYP